MKTYLTENGKLKEIGIPVLRTVIYMLVNYECSDLPDELKKILNESILPAIIGSPDRSEGKKIAMEILHLLQLSI